MLLEEVFCDVHTELIPASQHANQFPPVAEDQNELFCTMKTVVRSAQANFGVNIPLCQRTICQVQELCGGREHLGGELWGTGLGRRR